MSLYNPQHFATADEQAIRRVLKEYGFATLITSVGNEVVVSHVPVLFEPDPGAHGSVIGHVAGANPHAAALAQGASFLVFQGPFGYVSPNWYANPAGSVPTWNYVAIHVHGRVERLDGMQDKRAIVDALSATHEASFPHPWTSAKMDPPLLEKMLGAIVGFRMVVERIDAKFKLSQNRSSEDRAGVIAGLEERGSSGAKSLAAWMRKYAKP
jgi:transcriptional regulator